MITKLTGGSRCDPSQGDVRVADLYIANGKLVEKPTAGARIDHEYKIPGRIVMAGGIDIHTHIGGGKVNLARLLLPELVRTPNQRIAKREPRGGARPLTSPVPGAWETGRRYLELGYTACFEPAILPANARQSHLEMNDTPYLDTGGYLLLGNEELLLRWIAQGVPQSQINDYVGWMVRAHQCIAVKVVNAGGISAFKYNLRSLDVDDHHPRYDVTPGQVLRSLSQAVQDIGLVHPLHVHCSNLGVPGNIRSTLETIQAVEGRPMHLAHAQFHCYGKDGPHGFSSEASTLAEVINQNPQISLDVGQVLFGQTVTISGDTMHQFANRRLAKPNKAIFSDLECQAGCGVVPFRYRQSQYVHGLQWSIGLELFLMIKNPYQVFLTTDHPNGGPFTAYPHLIRLLMDYDYRMSVFSQLHPDVKATSKLPSLKREYTLDEIAIMTRLGPAKILGLHEMGHLLPGGKADVVVYRSDIPKDEVFARPEMVFRNGELVYKEGQFLRSESEMNVKQTHIANPEYDSLVELHLKKSWSHYYLQSMENTVVRPPTP